MFEFLLFYFNCTIKETTYSLCIWKHPAQQRPITLKIQEKNIHEMTEQCQSFFGKRRLSRNSLWLNSNSYLKEDYHSIITYQNKMSLNTLKFHKLNLHRPFFRSLQIFIIIHPDVRLDVVIYCLYGFLLFNFLFSIAQFFTYEYPNLWPLFINSTYFFTVFHFFP